MFRLPFRGVRKQRSQRRSTTSLQLELLETRTVPSGLTLNFVNQTAAPNPSGFFVAITNRNANQYYDPTANSGAGAWVAVSGNVPSFPLFSSLTMPDGYSGIIVIFAGQQLSLPGIGAPGPTDPNVQTVPYELVEYTTNGANSAIDTSQVDQFGFPLTLTDNSSDGHSHNVVGVLPTLVRVDEFVSYQNYMANQGANGAAYMDLVLPVGSISPNGNNVVRVLNPGKYLAANPFNTSPLHTAFDGALQPLFQRTDLQFTINSTSDGTNGTYTGTPKQVSATDRDGNPRMYNALQFTNGTITFNVFEPFFSNSGPTNGYAGKPLSPQWIETIGLNKLAASPGSMTFQGNGVFADWAGGPHAQGNKQAAAAIELQMNAALNRGISNLPVSSWNTGFYPANSQPRNLYAQFLHQTSGTTQVFVNGLAYGFAYDEGTGGGPSKIDFNDASNSTISIALGPWVGGGGGGGGSTGFPLPKSVFVTAADAGGGPDVKVFNADGSVRAGFFAFDTNFTGGVRVAVGDVNGDGFPDIICAAGPGGGPNVVVFSGLDRSEIYNFFAFNINFTGGCFVGAGDVNGDGFADIIVGADAGGGPNVFVLSGKDRTPLLSYFPYDIHFTGGVRVAAGDVNGDGRAEIITGAGIGGGPNVTVYQLVNGQPQVLQSYFAFDLHFAAGIFVGSGDVNGDGKADVIAGSGPISQAEVQFVNQPTAAVFSGVDASPLARYAAFPQDAAFPGAVRVAATDRTGSGKASVITVHGPGGTPDVDILDGLTGALLDRFFAYNPNFTGGIYLANTSR